MLLRRQECSETRSLSEISEVDAVRIGTDIVSAARRLIALLRSVGDCQWLHHPPVIAEAIRRYDDLWMPLISDLTVNSKPPMILPPLDIEWVWFCHSLNPVSYRDYCHNRFSKLIGKPAIYDDINEDYAVLQCEKIWITKYPEESFENRADQDSPELVSVNQDIKTEVEKQRFLWEKFSAPYMSETVYLISATLRYKGFLLILHKFKDEIFSLLPASDILIIWLTHQSYPTVYSEDVDEILQEMIIKVVRVGEAVEKTQVETTKTLWNRYFNQPYEKAGGDLTVISNESRLCNNILFYWPVSDVDINTAYKSIRPRFVLELCIFIKLNPKAERKESSFLRLKVARCHRKLQLDKKLTDLSQDSSWEKSWHLYCEFGTQGVVLESHCHRRRGICFKRGRKPEGMIVFLWNDLLRTHSLASGRFLGKQMSVFASITPPVQAPYLLRFVPDRVTDDSGAMISDSVQRTNSFRPQEGRWLTRTVLDHAGRECFVIRIRVGKGVFKRGGEVPSPVKSEETITEIRVGSWSYVEGSIGKAPAKVVGTATPKESVDDREAAWEFSTGEELEIRWDSSGYISELSLHSRSPGSRVRLLPGRRMQYKRDDGKEEEVEDDGFVTVVRSTEEDPTEKATALIDWKHQAMEFLPEEDAVFVLLLSVSILRSVTKKRREDVGKLLVRKRITEATGERDWGSVIVDVSTSNVSSSSCPYVEPWYRNSGKVMAMEEKAQVARYPYPVMSYSNVDGGDNLYKHVIFR